MLLEIYLDLIVFSYLLNKKWKASTLMCLCCDKLNLSIQFFFLGFWFKRNCSANTLKFWLYHGMFLYHMYLAFYYRPYNSVISGIYVKINIQFWLLVLSQMPTGPADQKVNYIYFNWHNHCMSKLEKYQQKSNMIYVICKFIIIQMLWYLWHSFRLFRNFIYICTNTKSYKNK